ncbi:MAG: hypothetical protein OQK59_07625 [Chlorobium sp.]|nr:hypothetical protein [Chlorobium sp.]MCW8819900.1 hypothetical protein [Ignavibacteriaceae bacterium]NEX13226.1 hypothetical protein [Prosthecochloris sp.]
MPAGEIFKTLTGQDTEAFNSVEEINKYVEEWSGKPLEVKLVYEDVVSCRGSVLPVKDFNPDSAFEKAFGDD